LQDELKVKDALVKERERRVAELEQSGMFSYLLYLSWYCIYSTSRICAVKDVRVELDAEIVRSKELLARRPHSHSQHSKAFPGEGDPRHTAAIRFYEDFSNLLVMNIKWEPREGVEDDVVHQCMYTYFGTVREDEVEVLEHVENSKFCFPFSYFLPCLQACSN